MSPSSSLKVQPGDFLHHLAYGLVEVVSSSHTSAEPFNPDSFPYATFQVKSVAHLDAVVFEASYYDVLLPG